MGNKLNGEKQGDHQGYGSQKVLDVFESMVPDTHHMTPAHRDKRQGHGGIHAGCGGVKDGTRPMRLPTKTNRKIEINKG